MRAIYENHYLSDTDVANFARQSFADLAKNFTQAQNNNLVKFLARGMTSQDWENLANEFIDGVTLDKAKELATYCRKIACHWVPFGHPQITLRMSAPVPIRVQCFKHKIGFVESEESRRYIKSKPTIYYPKVFREAAANVKQGSAGAHPKQENLQAVYAQQMHMALQAYEYFIEAGVCPEQARFILPQGCEVNWVWTGSLYAYANFYNQRSDPHAQKEIQELAAQVNEIIAPLYPISWSALTAGQY